VFIKLFIGMVDIVKDNIIFELNFKVNLYSLKYLSTKEKIGFYNIKIKNIYAK